MNYICITATPTGNVVNLAVDEVNAIRWLENNEEPREEVIARWTATRSSRINAIDALGIQGYFDRFQATKRSDGYILVTISFFFLSLFIIYNILTENIHPRRVDSCSVGVLRLDFTDYCTVTVII